MQALKLEPRDGLRWIADGWRMLRRQPIGFMALLFLFWLLLLASTIAIGFVAQGLGALLPFVSADVIAATGSLLFAALTPALTVGFLQACRLAAGGGRIHPILLFAPFAAGRTIVRRLLGLGLIQVVALVVIVFALEGSAAFVADAPPEAPARTASTTPSTAQREPESAAPTGDDEATRKRATALATQAIAYLPVSLLMWYAPMLVAWHGVPVGKSLFFSLVGVWRNRGAFAVYAIGWIAIWMTASVTIALISLAIGIANIAAIVVAPLAMLLLTAMYCSMYQSYATVYVESPKPEVVVA